MLPTTESDGQPHRNLTTFEVYDEELVLVAGVPPNGRQYEKLRVDESGRFAIVPLPEDLDERIVNATEIEDDVDMADMRVIGQAYGLEDDGDATAELRIDGEIMSSYSYAGVYGLLWVPFDHK